MKTDTYGAQNVIEAAVNQGVSKVMALSTDKATSPINPKGGVKLILGQCLSSSLI